MQLILFSAFAALVEAGLAGAVLVGHLDVNLALATHVCLAMACGSVAGRSGNAALGTVCATMVLFAGLVGVVAVATLALGLAHARRRPADERERWYRSLAGYTTADPVARLSAEIANGRAYDPDLARIAPFRRFACAGAPVEQQRLLGLMVQQPDAAFARTLRILLRSPMPAVRASAAAALARSREDVRTRAAAALSGCEAGGGASSTAARARTLVACAAMGVLEEADARVMRTSALDILLSSAPRTDAAAEIDTLIGELLLADGRIAETITRLESIGDRSPYADALLKRAYLRAGSMAEVSA